MQRSRQYHRIISVFLLLVFLNSVFFPTVSFALTSGPSQPEFSSFEPVSSSNMVDEFTGDFTYNLPVLEIPGPQGSSYPISLSYHSGVTPQEEASWVGYGWTLNAGAINRDTRGLPDDYNGKNVSFYNKMPKNWTATVGGGASFGEVFGKDLKVSANGSIRYNNYRGFGYNAGTGIILGRGIVSMGYNVSDGTGSFSLNVNPYAILNYTKVSTENLRIANKQRYIDKPGNKGNAGFSKLGSSINLIGSNYGVFSYTHAAKPSIVHSYSGKSFNVSVGITGNPAPVPIGISTNVFGSYSYQINDPLVTTPAYGYLYSAGAGTENALMDYHVEHEKDFNPRDAFLGVPFNDADNFIVTGEGIGGGFRLHNKSAGQFSPRQVSSKVDIFNVGGDIGAGWTFGPGVDLGKGESTLSVSDWNKNLSSFEHPRTSIKDEPVFFRFNNDLGGEWGDVHSDAPIQASLSGKNPSIRSEYFSYNASGKRSGRSSYIGYHTNGEMMTGAAPSMVAYSRIPHVNSISGRSLAERSDLIGELAVFNESGAQYTYGLPVYNRNESSLSYSVRDAAIDHNNLAYTDILNDEVKLGETKESQYASTYLLTEILTPDYNDRGVSASGGEHGSSPDDAGGYTRFNYRNVYAPGASDWYDWRAPYKGLQYNKGSHSDPLDDTGGYSEGEKEIYYLHSVETKTHVAIFRTSARNDSYEAPANAHQSSAGRGSQQLEKLVSIELYTISDFQQAGGNLVREEWGTPKLKTDLPKPVKTVFFDYNNSLSGNLPNAADGEGKLTLKRVYFEYNGISKSRISPYEFSYKYPDYATYPAKYKSGEDDVTADYKLLQDADQNPPYNDFSSDAWGNYQRNGVTRFDSMRTWVNQNEVSNKNNFDPAAWHLKKITLPSGGQIHVQYEQDDYSYVQNQEAHVMVALKKRYSDPFTAGRYYLDIGSIGLEPEHADELVRMINDRYVTGGNKMYFKILYSLVGDLFGNQSPPDLNTCNAEFITGYASLSACGKEGSDVWVEMLASQRLPDRVCEDFVKAQRLGKVVPGQNCNPSVGLSDGTDAKTVVLQLLSMAKNVRVPVLCQAIEERHSYLRVPTPLAKKGGGVRVKRLLMFNTDLEGAPVLYGNEYLYKTTVGTRTISSGVATNEPQTIREENILTDFVARKNQSTWSKIVAGRDKDNTEGPLGESILPGPSVGYSKIITKNIHSGLSNDGFSISEFFTARNYPVTLAHPDNGSTMTTIKAATPPDRKLISTPFYTEIVNKNWATQGFSFVLNNMHGQPRKTASYSGPYSDVYTLSKSTLVSSTIHRYYEPGEKVPMVNSLLGSITMKNPGREVDITFAQRKVVEKQKDVNVEVDFQVAILPLLFIVLVIPYPTAVPTISNIEGEMSTHVTSKVVRYPAIAKQVEIYENGITHTQENLAFDEYTGRPVAVRSSDEFKGAYLAQNIPASWEYKSMAGKWSSENKTVEGTFSFSANVIEVTAGSCSLASFTAGDKIRLGSNTSTAYYHITGIDWLNNKLQVEPSLGGSVASGDYNRITIIRSGRTNQLQEQAGSITAHHEVKNNLAPISVDPASRYETATNNSYVSDLKNATHNRTSGTGNFILIGPYTLMNMSAFAGRLTACPVDLTKATVKRLQYRYAVNNGKITLDLMSFDIKCSESPETWTTIAAEGWQ
jgi:hypothetical protein